MLVDLWYPEGTSYAANEAVTKRVEARVMKLEGVDHVTTWVGSGAERFVLVLDQIFPQSNVSQMIVLPKDLAARERLRKLLPELLATEFPEVRGRAKLLPNGPPVPYPVQFRVVGPDPAKVRAYADEVKAIMRGNPNLRGINDNWNESVKVLRLEVDQDKARALGVSSQAIAQAARTHQQRHHHRPVPRRRQADRHRAAPAAGRAQRDHRPGQRLRADDDRPQHPARRRSPRPTSSGSRACCGAKGATTRPRCRATSSKACRAPP